MSTFKEIDQLGVSDIESFFDSDTEITYDFVQAASRSKLPRAFVSRHTYVGAVSKTRLVMWAKRRSVAKTVADIACSIDLEELSIDDTWLKRHRKGCELLFPDGQRVLIESMDKENIFVETLTENIIAIHGASKKSDEVLDGEGTSVFSEPGVARTDTAALEEQVVAHKTQQDSKPKTPVVTREVIIESLKRASDGVISPSSVKAWAMKVRDYQVIDADEAMVGYILFSLSRIDDTDNDKAIETITEYYERLKVTLV